MNILGYLEDTFKLIKQEPIILIGGGLLLQLLLFLSQGILFFIAGPLLGGYLLLIILALRENKKPVFNDIFSGLYQFKNLLPYTLVVLVIFIGLMLLIIPGIIFATWWIYVLPLMVDKKINFSKAMGLSMNKVNQTGFFKHLIFLLLITLIPLMFFNFVAATMPILIALSVLLPPFQVGCLASIYIDQFKDPAIESDTGQKEKTTEAASAAPPPEKFTEAPAEEEGTTQAEQPVSEETKTSEQPATESLPQETVLDQKPDQGTGNPLNQSENEPVPGSEKDNKGTV